MLNALNKSIHFFWFGSCFGGIHYRNFLGSIFFQRVCVHKEKYMYNIYIVKYLYVQRRKQDSKMKGCHFWWCMPDIFSYILWLSDLFSYMFLDNWSWAMEHSLPGALGLYLRLPSCFICFAPHCQVFRTARLREWACQETRTRSNSGMDWDTAHVTNWCI